MKANKNAIKLGVLLVSSLLSIMVKSLNEISIAQVKKGEMYL